MERSSDFYDSRTMWIAEPKKPKHGGRRLIEEIPKEIPIGDN